MSFYRCPHCNQLRTEAYAYCPGCYSATVGCAPTSETHVDTNTTAVTGNRTSRRFSIRFDCLAAIVMIAVALLSRNALSVDALAQNVSSHQTQDAQLTRLRTLEEKAQSENTYPSELRFLDQLIVNTTQGHVQRNSYSPQVKTLDIVIPEHLTPKKAENFASIYHYLFVNMRHEFMPSNEASDCRVTIYDSVGQPLATKATGSTRS